MFSLSKLMRLEVGIMAVLLLGSIFGPDFLNVKIGPIPVTIDRVVWGIVIVFFLIQWKTWRLPKVNLHWGDFLLLAFLGYLVANIATSDWKYNKYQPVAQWLFFYLIPAGLYLVARYLPHREAFTRIGTFSLIGMGVYLAVIAVLEVKNLHFLIYPRYIVNSPMIEFLGRGRGPFLNPIVCGIVQTLALACGLLWWKPANRNQRIAIAGFSALMLVGIFCTLTRSVWLSAGIVVLGFAWFYASYRLRAVMIMGIPLAGFLFFTVGKEKLNSFKRDKNVTAAEMAESIQLRPLLAVIAKKMVEDRPFFGHGFRQYQQSKKEYHYRDTSNLPVQKVLPFVQHNLFLAYAVDIGIFGLGIYLSLLMLWTWVSLRLLLAPHVPFYAKQTAALFSVALISVVVNGMFHDVAVIPMLNHFVFCLAGWAVGQHQYFLIQKEKHYLACNKLQPESDDSDDGNLPQNQTPPSDPSPTPAPAPVTSEEDSFLPHPFPFTFPEPAPASIQPVYKATPMENPNPKREPLIPVTNSLPCGIGKTTYFENANKTEDGLPSKGNQANETQSANDSEKSEVKKSPEETNLFVQSIKSKWDPTPGANQECETSQKGIVPQISAQQESKHQTFGHQGFNNQSLEGQGDEPKIREESSNKVLQNVVGELEEMKNDIQSTTGQIPPASPEKECEGSVPESTPFDIEKFTWPKRVFNTDQ